MENWVFKTRQIGVQHSIQVKSSQAVWYKARNSLQTDVQKKYM